MLTKSPNKKMSHLQSILSKKVTNFVSPDLLLILTVVTVGLGQDFVTVFKCIGSLFSL